MAPQGSVSRWIGPLQAGEEVAAERLWKRYFPRLVGLAHKKLQGTRLATADEEDVALSAFDSFCRGLEAGRFPLLSDRENLWRLLVVLTARKAAHLLRDQCRQKRGGGEVLETETELEQILSREPTPEFSVQVAEECQRLLDRLNDAELRAVAVWKMEGYTNEEIAAKLGCVPRTVDRKLRSIRSLWEQESIP
ncbi:MAG TPA: ECF-type sigma factor [Gemmataceae bacterium]|nr:ECF-type sigma factor [Gemmataceae bacterium]